MLHSFWSFQGRIHFFAFSSFQRSLAFLGSVVPSPPSSKCTTPTLFPSSHFFFFFLASHWWLQWTYLDNPGIISHFGRFYFWNSLPEFNHTCQISLTCKVTYCQILESRTLSIFARPVFGLRTDYHKYLQDWELEVGLSEAQLRCEELFMYLAHSP